MAMLAEPRRKQKIGPNPRGKFFMEDASNKGRTLLQKLGWQSGDGLGKQNQGMSAPLCPKIQMDSKGLGYDPKNDPWVVHNEEFSQILENLSPIGPADSSKAKLVEEPENNNSDGEAEVNGKLESKSKKSKFRIHYHKFVRNKDVSNFSKTDLKCIFGKPTDALISKDSAGSEAEGKSKLKTEDDGSEGFKTVNSGSMADYFKNKMQKIRDASKLKQEEKTEDEKQNQINRGSMFDYFKAKLEERRAKAAQSAENEPIISIDEVDTSIAQADETMEAIEEPQPKSKKSKRKVENTAETETAPAKKSKKSKAENIEENPAESNGISDKVGELIEAQKDRNRAKGEKRKKVKNASDYEVLISEENTETPETPEQEDSEPPKKKKKKKSKETSDLPTEDSQEANLAPEQVDSAQVVKKDKKKKKSKETSDLSTEDSQEANQALEQVDSAQVEKKDKKKKKKKHEEVAVEDQAPLLDEIEAPVKKSKKKSKAPEPVPEVTESLQEDETIEKSKKKRKKKKESSDSSDEPILAVETSTQEQEEQAPAEDDDSLKKRKKKDKRHLEAGELNDISKSFPGANLHKIPGYAFY